MLENSPGRACVDCGGLVTPARSGRPRVRCTTCSPVQAKPVSMRMQNRMRQTACPVCGNLFTSYFAGQKYCAEKCRNRVSNTSERHRSASRQKVGGSHRRRARFYGGEYESFNPFAVFDRDGWICRICGDATPKDLRGKVDDKAPELDHAIPLSRGGAHTIANTQCVCRACNQAKGARTMAEFLGEPVNA
jgi:5-methylcytosine-specific restriction endonuclease McrA